jgi:Transposase IS66 family
MSYCPGTPPNSALGNALGYTHRKWPKLLRHLDHPEIPVDNNYSEQQIKHFATGRKAWLFSYDAGQRPGERQPVFAGDDLPRQYSLPQYF